MATQPAALRPPHSGRWPRWLAGLGLGNRVQLSWAFYDWANSAFATTILAAVFPIYYVAIATAGGLEGNAATVAFSYTSAISLLLMAVAGPILGSIADYAGTKKRFLALFTVVGCIFTASLALVGQGQWVWASALFIAANIGYGGALVFYDALLPHVATPAQIDRVSTAGYALGYLGGGLLLVLNVAWILAPATFGFGNTTQATQAALASVAIWWAIFAIPMFRAVREPAPRFAAGERPGGNPIGAGFGRLIGTFRELRRYRNLFLFLIAFWLYNDGINTIIRMATVYGTEIGIGQTDLIGALVLTQFLGIPFTFAFGPLAERIGRKNALYLSLSVYVVISICGYFITTAWQFWALAAAVATVQGGSQAISRSIFGTMIPRAQSSEFFGFFSVSSKFAGIVGPLVFAIVSQLMGSSRLSIVSLLVFFIGGIVLLTRVDIAEGERVAAAEDARLSPAPA